MMTAHVLETLAVRLPIPAFVVLCVICVPVITIVAMCEAGAETLTGVTAALTEAMVKKV